MKTIMISTLIEKILSTHEPLEKKAAHYENSGQIKKAFDIYKTVHPDKANQLYGSMQSPTVKYKNIQEINPIIEQLTDRTKLYYKQN